MPHLTRKGLAFGAVATLSLAGVAVAQPAPPPAPNAPNAPVVRQDRQVIIRRDDRDGPRRVEVRRPGRDRADIMMRSSENRAERLRTMLQLTANQESALQAFLTATAPPRRDVLRPAVAERGPQTAVERADRMAEATARIAADTKKRADATRTFYAALTPSQKKVFDTTAGMVGGPVMRTRVMRFDGPPPAPPAAPRPPAPPRAG